MIPGKWCMDLIVNWLQNDSLDVLIVVKGRYIDYVSVGGHVCKLVFLSFGYVMCKGAT